MYDSQTAPRCSLGHGKQSEVKGIFVHLLYGFVWFTEIGPEQRTYAICIQPVTNWEVLQDLVQQVYDSKTAHRRSLGGLVQCAVNGIFVHLLYGVVRFPKVGQKQRT